MAPFEPPHTVINGFKERVDALTVQGDRLYIGTAVGNVHIYSINESSEEPATLVDIKKGISRKAIDQLGHVKDINSLVVLSDMQVSLYPLPEISTPTPLPKAKAAFSFAIHTSVQHLYPDGTDKKPTGAEFSTAVSVPSVVTDLVVGCRRKLVIYSWKDGEPQDVKEAALPHSARTIAFLTNDIVSLSYSPTEHILFSLESLTATEIATPPVASVSAVAISNMGMGALSGLGGYMTLGLGAKAKPCVTNVSSSEVLIAKDNDGLFIGVDGKPSRSARIDWPAPPEDLSFVAPYIFSVLPANTVPTQPPTSSPQPSFVPSPVLQVHSSISLNLAQSVPFPFSDANPPSAPTTNYSVRLLTASPFAKSPLFVVSTPTDRTAATVEGSSIWRFRMRPWSEQVDELVNAGLYVDALALLDTIDVAVLPDKDRRRLAIQGLNAVARFKSGDFDQALNTFIELNINPAKVIALYPESVSGRLSVPREQWIPLFGGPAPSISEEPALAASEQVDSGGEEAASPPVESAPATSQSPPSTGLRSKFTKYNPLEAIRPSGPKDPETASIASTKKAGRAAADDYARAIESLFKYLPDRRTKLIGALEAFHITPAHSHRHSPLSESSPEDLRDIPSAPLSVLTPDQLVRYAQVVDTALFKSYLIARPGLLGALCRRDNWCEVSEVEEVLAARERFPELIDLYNVRKMHSKALDLLRKLSDKELDMRDKLGPSITYLQRLGPEYIDQVFKHSLWVFEQDADMAFEIFTSEEVELAPSLVANFLEGVDPKHCARYLEFLIEERNEEAPQFHDRLAELYLKMSLDAKKKGDTDAYQAVYAKLLTFIDTTNRYRLDRLFSLLPTDDLFEAKAILLGRLGRHDSALELYVYRLRDYDKAERYCKRIYKPDADTHNIFLTLLRIYLRPLIKTTDDLLRPAIALISRNGARLDPEEALQLLPPLVGAQDVREFLLAALRAPVFDTKVVRDISKARNEQVARKLMYLEANRVKVTDSRICPQCHKRLGHSVIAVHAPGGEVTHYQCREAFSRKLKEMRHS
ncbi:hypothetical protein FA95DRAFT_1611206 [Auriscalpium vulgare]|uniref:Uncharacterized protein n=1 Tax=Auriscalpium vulgare TaxID=40419 RepID=A0ACB8RAN1_9AGAM|nr:hypothetical protein FA95DRAFT_1611206 [Auriscalpium vulgare]